MTSLLLLDTALQARRRFLNNALDAAGRSNVRALWTPEPSEGLTVPDGAVASRAWTHATSPNGRVSPLGKGYALAFNGTSDFLTCPDATDLSFGDGATDQSFSVFVLAKVTDTALSRVFLGKNGEWSFGLDTADKALMQLVDLSVVAVPSRLQDTATTRQGTWAAYSGTYSKATGGATAANDITIYENGVAVASTPTNAGTYVAMENGADVVTLGAVNNGASSFIPGAIALVILFASNALAASHAQLTQACRGHFGAPA